MKRIGYLVVVFAAAVALSTSGCGPKTGDSATGKPTASKKSRRSKKASRAAAGSATKTVARSSAGVTTNPEALRVFKQGVKTLEQGRRKGKATHQQAIQQLKEGARAAVPRPALRALQKKWDQDEISEEDYRKERLPHMCQAELRRAQRFRRRLEVAEREFAGVSRVPLQDHEIAHIWCLPLSSLAARKVKAFHQYLQSLQAKAQAASPETTSRTAPPPDYWKETFSALTGSPVQHSVDSNDGMEGSETALMDKLTAFASGALPDELESRFWQTVSRDYSPNAVEGQGKRQSLFALQRLSAILSEMDQSLESLEHELLTKISPTPKVLAGEGAEPPSAEAVPQLGDMAEHVLRSLRGEERS